MTSATVDLYLYDLDVVRSTKNEAERTLSADEIARAARFKLAALRLRYLAAHQLLRGVLAARLDTSPGELSFRVGSHGKPELVGGPAFNMAHCESILLIAVADKGRLGVDVELVREIDGRDELAQKHFSSAERAEWQTLPEEERARAFLRVWTRKEAFLKAVGKGLSVPLGELSVALREEDGNALRDALRVVSDPDRWSIRSVALRDDAEAAVAWDQPRFKVRLVAEPDTLLS